MAYPFAQLFGIAEEVVGSRILPMLSLKEIVSLDTAMTCRAARVVGLRWCNNLTMDCEIRSKTKLDYLAYLKARKIKIGALTFRQNQDETMLNNVETATIEAESAIIFCQESQSTQRFATSLRKLRSVIAYSYSVLTDVLTWEALFTANPDLRTIELIGRPETCCKQW